MRERHGLTQSDLRRLLSLDYETGLFTRLITKGSRFKAGTIATPLPRGGYMRVCINWRQINYAHVVWCYVHGYWPKEIDHINGNRADNRPANLREATRSQNMQARKEYRSNRHGYRGVTRLPSGRYQAKLSVDGRKRHIGTYDTPEKAYAAYCEVVRCLRGNFACTD